MRAREHSAWLLPWIGIAVMRVVCGHLDDEIGFARSSAVALGAGVALGVGWFLLHPRPLARRLFGLMTVLTILILIAGVAGELRPEITGSALFTPLGVLAGLVFAEVRDRRRRDAAAPAGDEERAVRVPKR